jgi:Protein of unknown function (DUF3307)
MDILVLLLLLQIKHWYADFVIQTYKQTVRKGIYKDPVGISHSLDHVWTSMIVLLIFDFLHHIDPLAILWLPIVEGVVHYHIDWIKVHFGCKDMTKPLFWNQFGQDQLAHQVTYLAISALLLT